MRWSWISLLLLASLPPVARADGGTVRLSERRHGYQITVFTSPNPWRAGPVDVSVLVQELASGDPLTDLDITIDLTPLDHAGPTLRARATSSTATNKLFHAAEFDLPHPGRWRVAVTGPVLIAESCVFDLEADAPPPSWLPLAPWLGWPLLVIALFIVHQYLTRRRSIPADLTAAAPSSTLTAPDRELSW